MMEGKMIELKVKKINEEAKLPEYAHESDAGMDLFSVEEKIIEPGETALIKTGIVIELPHYTEAQVRPRSGLALKNSITVLNTPGTIDEGYRGEIGVILINHSKIPFKVEKQMKIAQMVIKPIIKVSIKEVKEVASSDRNSSGFGSTGMK
jgi:dUTP pyrophosphatase